jgi:hypothetical protein
VRIIGLEPTRLAAPDPKSGMSTNFTISAKLSHLIKDSHLISNLRFCECKYKQYFVIYNTQIINSKKNKTDQKKLEFGI